MDDLNYILEAELAGLDDRLTGLGSKGDTDDKAYY